MEILHALSITHLLFFASTNQSITLFAGGRRIQTRKIALLSED
jgi:hypothetical protein